MHKLSIVDFETAKDLKELGFDWECDYYKEGSDYIVKCYNPYNWNKTGFDTSLPEQALVVKWLRDVHNKYIEFATTVDLKWDYSVNTLQEGVGYAGFFANPNAYDTYEEAELQGIKECIKYLKNEI